MKRQLSIGLLAGATLLVPALADQASARSVSAASAAIFTSSNVTTEHCAEYHASTGALRSRCRGLAVIPLTTDFAGTKAATFTARTVWSEPTFGPTCRAVGSDRFGTAISASWFEGVPQGTGAFVSFTTDPVAVPSRGVFLVFCTVNDGTEFNEFDYAP